MNERPTPDFRALYRAAREANVDYEANVRRSYEWVLREGDSAVDVGAHSGKHALPMARCVGETGRVFAFEPLPEAAACLRGHAERAGLDCIDLRQAAVSDTPAESTTFFRAINAVGQSGLKKRAYTKASVVPEAIEVKVLTLDDVVGQRPIRFIKIDVEGAELHVLRGATKTVDRDRPLVAFEWGRMSYGAYGVEPEEMFAFFSDRDYVVLDILGNELPTAELFVLSDGAPGVWDYLAMPKEYEARVQLQSVLQRAATRLSASASSLRGKIVRRLVDVPLARTSLGKAVRVPENLRKILRRVLRTSKNTSR